MTNDVKNVPEWRFAGFENTWETKKLHQIVDVKDGTHESPKPTDDGYLLVTSKNLKNSTLDFSESYSISKEDYEDINKRSKVEIGDILFGMIGTIGNPILLEKDGFAIKNVALLKTSSLQEREYILNFLKSNSITKQFYKLNVGGTQKFISLRSIRDLKIDIPSSEEAIKIGGFFNKLDRQIELEEQKLEKLEEQKKGYMQQIFSQQLRFKDENGDEYPEWEKQKLYDVVKYLSSKRSSNHYSENIIHGEYPVYDAVQEISKDVNFDIKESYISILKDGAGAGRLNLRPGKSSVIGTMGYLLPQNIDINFLFYYLKTMNFTKFIIGSTIPHLYFKDYSKEKIFVPKDIDEQNKIGSFFLKLDYIIDNKNKKIEMLKERKKGFLQKMFV
ncbi:restriction endonuclease subunit S [Staphylococcus saprophyticus]|uniref:restriction endonuclease subunit S n=1 Tax=Staphylococcus saprophyticus TaxID=29385 RepID=UPI003F549129